jgi:hypothetical protein
MTYGYNSKLSSHGVDTIMDYGRSLLEELKKIRSTEEVSKDAGCSYGYVSVGVRKHEADICNALAATAATVLHRTHLWRYHTRSCRLSAQ